MENLRLLIFRGKSLNKKAKDNGVIFLSDDPRKRLILLIYAKRQIIPVYRSSDFCPGWSGLLGYRQ